jgi:hypothetical protein
MTDTIGSTPQPARPQQNSEQARLGRFRLPEPAQQPEGPEEQRSAEAFQRATVTPGSPRATAPAPEHRYGEKRGLSRPRKIGLAATGLVILGSVAGYIGWEQSHPTIQGTVTKFNASSTSVVVTFEVDKPADKSARCTLAAEDTHGAVVGSASVPILAGRAKNVQNYTLQTTTTATTVIVESCSLTS